ncbi:hypothetical protein LOAG_19060 [Loa loa]|uniref:Uncharacterized protein n=1 Tax=Loa loa TaxID=7209 RepID=A0A1S0UDL9_LOALO|nr:hypothetical protein LOAG_19060 [Loa loa]EJD73521.1 hypothetical protein LOAG_19060 [Loa loa]
MLERINKEWKDFVQTIFLQQQKIVEMMEDDQGILNLTSRGMEAVITSKKYEDDPEDKIRHLESFNNLRSKGEFASELSQQKRETALRAASGRNDREWKTTIENIKRLFRQLQESGENLEHTSLRVIIEKNLPKLINVHEQRLKDESFCQ